MIGLIITGPMIFLMCCLCCTLYLFLSKLFPRKKKMAELEAEESAREIWRKEEAQRLYEESLLSLNNMNLPLLVKWNHSASHNVFPTKYTTGTKLIYRGEEDGIPNVFHGVVVDNYKLPGDICVNWESGVSSSYDKDWLDWHTEIEEQNETKLV